MKKYNIALLPSAKNDDFVKLSAQLSFLKTQYQLGDNSLPHVTLLQFYSDQNQVDEIWKNTMHHLDEHSIDLEFNCFSFMTFNNYIFYISLIPNNISILHKMHSQLSLLFTPINNKPYDPHLTLISTIDKSNETKSQPIVKKYITLSDKFTLSLGVCDEIGQFTNVIRRV